MFQSLKNLLPEALKRGRMTRQIEASRLVEAAEAYLDENLPGERRGDARAAYFREEVLTVDCLNSAAGQWVSFRKNEIIEHLRGLVPDIPVKQVRVRLVAGFRDTIGPL